MITMAVKVINNTKKIKTLMLKNIFNALDAVGFFVEGEAKRRTPVDNGALINSFDHEVNTSNKIVRIGNTMEYAVYVEKGSGIFAVDGNGRQTPWVYFYDGGNGEKGYRITVGQKPQPFLTPAGEENIDTIIKIIATQLKKGLS